MFYWENDERVKQGGINLSMSIIGIPRPNRLKTRTKVYCPFCGKKRMKLENQVNEKHNFCNQTCYGNWKKEKPTWNKDKSHPNYKKYIRLLKKRTWEKNPNFKHGHSADKTELFRKANMEMTTCKLCSSEKNIEIHHKDENQKNNIIENLQILCKSCHTKKHKKEKNFTGGKKNECA